MYHKGCQWQINSNATKEGKEHKVKKNTDIQRLSGTSQGSFGSQIVIIICYVVHPWQQKYRFGGFQPNFRLVKQNPAYID